MADDSPLRATTWVPERWAAKGKQPSGDSSPRNPIINMLLKQIKLLQENEIILSPKVVVNTQTRLSACAMMRCALHHIKCDIAAVRNAPQPTAIVVGRWKKKIMNESWPFCRCCRNVGTDSFRSLFICEHTLCPVLTTTLRVCPPSWGASIMDVVCTCTRRDHNRRRRRAQDLCVSTAGSGSGMVKKKDEEKV